MISFKFNEKTVLLAFGRRCGKSLFVSSLIEETEKRQRRKSDSIDALAYYLSKEINNGFIEK